jgi:hypothetical protein
VASVRPGTRVQGPPDVDVEALEQKYGVAPIWQRVFDEARALRAVEASRLGPGQVPPTRRVGPAPATERQEAPAVSSDYYPGSALPPGYAGPPQVLAAVEHELARLAPPAVAPAPLTQRAGAAAPPTPRPPSGPPVPPGTLRSRAALPVPAPAPARTYAGAAEVCSRRAVTEALARNPGNKSAAARELGLTREGLRGVLQRYGLATPVDPALRAVRSRAGAAGAAARWQ